MAGPPDAKHLARTLGPVAATSLVVGSVVGSGIFLAPAIVAGEVPAPGLVLLVWVVGGALSLMAALTLAELGAMFPRAGGQYVFLKEAYGEGPGFLFGWMALVVNYSGTIAAVAAAFGLALGTLWGFGPGASKLVAIGCIWVLTAVNLLGLRHGSAVQVASTVAKVAGLLGLVGFGIFLGDGPDASWTDLSGAPVGAGLLGAFGVALVAALFAFDGLGSATFVGGEVREPGRTIPRATVAAAVIVTAIYLMVNLALVVVLPMDRLAGNQAAAFDAGDVLAGATGRDLMAGAVAVATFGTINGYVLQTPRIYYAMARDRLLWRGFARLHPRRGTPVFGLLLQAEWASLLVLSGTFDQLITYVVMSSWLFLALTGLALFRLRRTRPDAPRPYRAWGYPLVPALFVGSAVLVVVNSLVNDPRDSLVGVGLALSGVPVYVFVRRRARRRRGSGPNTDS